MTRSCVRLACVAIAAFVIAGCAKLPEYREDPITTADVIRHIRCELGEAVWSNPEYGWLKEWKVGYTFTMLVDHTGGLDSENTWTYPLNRGATFVLALVGGFSGFGTRTETVDFDESLENLRKDGLPGGKLQCFGGEPERYARLGGKLGFTDLLERISLSREVANIDPDKLGYDLSFVIKKNASLTPRFNLIPIGKEKIFSGQLKWTGSQTDTQSLKLVFTPPAQKCAVMADPSKPWPTDRCPEPVYIVDARAVCGALKKPETCTRHLHCKWTPQGKGGVCGDAAPQRDLVSGRLLLPAPPAPAAPRGVTRADKENLDRARGRGVLQSIDLELQRQRIGI